MRPTSLALAVVAAAALMLAALPSAGVAARSRPCPKGTTAVKLKRGPRLCSPRRSAAGPAALLPFARLAKRSPGRPSPRLQKTAQKALSWAQRRPAAGTALARIASTTAPRARISAGGGVAVGERTSFGTVTGYRRAADGSERIVSRDADGVETVVNTRGENDVIDVETRQADGRSFTVGFSRSPATPDCPTARGDVPAGLEEGIIVGFGTTVHGKRTWWRIDARVEGRWIGHVGVGARAERFDLDVRGVMEMRSGVEIASTGKVLRRDPTRTYRSVLRKNGLPLGVAWEALAAATTMRGPKGATVPAGDVKLAGELAAKTFEAADRATAELETGDRRWYEERRCAKLERSSTPERVAKGGRGDWDVTVTAADGAVVPDARWTTSSGCGVLTASTDRGPKAHLTVTDTAGAWGPDTGNGACVSAEATSPAGRTPLLEETIPPEARRRLEVSITIRYTKGMGPGITETHMRGSGQLRLGDATTAGVYVEGTGEYTGSEWAQTPNNTCGEDMLRSRTFAGRATVGGQRNDDGTITVGFTADERPFDMAWIVVVPVTGGNRWIEARQPFCGDPGKALTNTNVDIAVREIVEDGW